MVRLAISAAVPKPRPAARPGGGGGGERGVALTSTLISADL